MYVTSEGSLMINHIHITLIINYFLVVVNLPLNSYTNNTIIKVIQNVMWLLVVVVSLLNWWSYCINDL